MTTRIYYTSDETQGQANVVQCIPDGEDGYVIELDATLFHPQGGGQPSYGTAPPRRSRQARSRSVSTVNYVIFMHAGIRPDI